MRANDFAPSARFNIEPLEQRTLLAAPIPSLPYNAETLTKKDVTNILAAAASQALPTQIITVVDRDGQILGILAMSQAKVKSIPVDDKGVVDPLLSTLNKSVGRARTVAFFESYQDAFTTRTARFIIQDHFAPNLPNTPGGPLYGVEFSDLPGSDVVSSLPLSGDPGGIPLFKDGVPVGGIGVAGDGSDRLVRPDLPYDPNTLPDPKAPASAPVNLYDGTEENDVDEQVALAGATKFKAPSGVQATGIFVGGFRFPFTKDTAKETNAPRTLDDLTSSGDATLVFATAKLVGLGGLPLTTAPYSGQTSAAPRGSPGTPFPSATMGGITGLIKNKIIGSNDTFGVTKGKHKATDIVPDADRLTKNDVTKIINQAVKEALVLRAGIRLPIGQPVQVHVSVVDRDGTLLGTFDMQDGTNFSYDVAVQKARTAAFFSDNKHAFSSRTIGFLSQKFFPVGIDDGLTGPLFHLQNGLSLGGPAGSFGIPNRTTTGAAGSATNPLPNGITTFPGGAPLYKNGQFVGAVGISGDGVDEDDEIAFAGTKNFQAPEAIRADHLSEDKIVNFLTNKVKQMQSLYNLVIDQGTAQQEDTAAEVLDRLPDGLDNVQLPFQKFPRNPEL
jgi:uncharacterized protein GlcG (DUF336 family)